MNYTQSTYCKEDSTCALCRQIPLLELLSRSTVPQQRGLALLWYSDTQFSQA